MDLKDADQCEREGSTSVRVEQPTEDASRIEAVETGPIDRAIPANQRSAVAVTDQRIVRDRCVLAVGHTRRPGPCQSLRQDFRKKSAIVESAAAAATRDAASGPRWMEDQSCRLPEWDRESNSP